MRPAPLPPAALLDEPTSLAARMRSLAALGSRHRRLVAAVCAGLAVMVTVSALTPAAPPASASSPSGAAGAPGGPAPPSALPAGAGASAPADAARVAVAVRLADPAGLLLLRAGSHAEVLASTGESGGIPVAGAGADSGSSAGPASGREGEVLAADAVVLAVPGAGGAEGAVGAAGEASQGAGRGGLLGDVTAAGLRGSGGGGDGGLEGVVLLAVAPPDARRIAAAGNRALSVAVALPGRASTAP